MSRVHRLGSGGALLLSLALLFPSPAKAQAASATSLSLEDAVRRAGTASSSVRAAEALAEAAQKKVGVALAAHFPTISASLSGAWLANPPGGVTVKAGTLATSPILLPSTDLAIVPDAKDSYFKGNLTLSQPIFAWGKIDAGLQLAKLEDKIAALGLQGSRLDAEREAKRSYDAALLSRDSAGVLGELRDLAADNARDAERALAAGTSTKAAVLLAESQLADLESRIVEAREGERSALEGLAVLTGVDADTLSLSSGFRDEVPTLDEKKILSAALAVSSEGGKAKTRLSEAARRLDLERGSSILLPDLALFASLDGSGQTIPFSDSNWMDSTWSWDLTLGIQTQLKVIDGGASFARIAAARAELSAAKVGVEGSEDSIRMRVRDAVSGARRAAASLSAKKARADWAAETLRAAKVSLDAGMTGRPDYNAAAMAEAGARLDLLYARYALSEALADLERLVGGNLP